MKSVADLGDLRGKRVLVRCDLNVPLDGETITDDGRIRASVPTLTQLRDAGAKVVVMAHLGRPKGQVNPKYSLAPAAKRLGELLGTEVTLAGDVVGPSAAEMVAGLGDGEIGMLENVRYEPAEESKVDAERAELAQKYASFGDVFVSDGFGVVHRKQASVYDVASLLPNAAGGLVLAEVEVLKRLTESPERPYVVVLGGAKVSDKLAVIANLLEHRRHARGRRRHALHLPRGPGPRGRHQPAGARPDRDRPRLPRAGARRAASGSCCPPTSSWRRSSRPTRPPTVVAADAMPADQLGLDIGPESAAAFADVVRGAKTVFWNGPMGVAEWAAFANGTRAVAQALTEVDGLSVVGGGDSAAAVRDLGFADDDFGHISTGGGASLEYLEGKTLPGLAVLG